LSDPVVYHFQGARNAKDNPTEVLREAEDQLIQPEPGDTADVGQVYRCSQSRQSGHAAACTPHTD